MEAENWCVVTAQPSAVCRNWMFIIKAFKSFEADELYWCTQRLICRKNKCKQLEKMLTYMMLRSRNWIVHGMCVTLYSTFNCFIPILCLHGQPQALRSTFVNEDNVQRVRVCTVHAAISFHLCPTENDRGAHCFHTWYWSINGAAQVQTWINATVSQQKRHAWLIINYLSWAPHGAHKIEKVVQSFNIIIRWAAPGEFREPNGKFLSVAIWNDLFKEVWP